MEGAFEKKFCLQNKNDRRDWRRDGQVLEEHPGGAGSADPSKAEFYMHVPGRAESWRGRWCRLELVPIWSGTDLGLNAGGKQTAPARGRAEAVEPSTEGGWFLVEWSLRSASPSAGESKPRANESFLLRWPIFPLRVASRS